MLNAGRNDYNHSIRMSQTLPGEPVFILKGHDPDAADTVRDYARRARDRGAPLALVESALQQADEMEAFPEKRAPDASHLSDDEQKQLAYQLSRRAWAERGPSPSLQELLAEKRGADAVVSQFRPILADLFANLVHDRATGGFTYTPSGSGDAIAALSLLGARLNLNIKAPTT